MKISNNQIFGIFLLSFIKQNFLSQIHRNFGFTIFNFSTDFALISKNDPNFDSQIFTSKINYFIKKSDFSSLKIGNWRRNRRLQ